MTRANKITIGRIFLVPIFFFLLNNCQKWGPGFRYLPLLVFLLAASLDILDGYLARKNKEVTRLGSILDPFADKLLMLTALFLIVFKKPDSFYGTLSPGFFYIVLSREIALISGAGILFLLKSNILIRPRFMGKAATFFQVMLIVTILAGLKQPVIDFLTVPAYLCVLLSLVIYIFDGIRQVNGPQDTKVNSVQDNV